MTSPESSAGTAAGSAKKLLRPRVRKEPYLPSWFLKPIERRAVAQQRCLMVLAVLAGQRTVSEVVAQEKIARAQFYLWESRALQGMLQALDPTPTRTPEEREQLKMARERLRQMGEQIKLVTQRKRGAERLLRLVLKSGRTPLKMPRGRPPKALARTTVPGADSL
jgi:hypothetical protein